MEPGDLLIILTSLLFSAFFSGMEIAFVTANKLKLELDNKLGNFSAKLITYFHGKPSKFITAMLIGNNIALVIYGLYMAKLLEPQIHNFTTNGFLILFIQTLISTLIILVTAEFLPKTIFRANANQYLLVLAIPLRINYFLLIPIVAFTTFLSNTILKVFFRVDPSEERPVFRKIDLDNFVKEATSNTNDNEELEHEIQIFQNALDFSSVKARDCMIPRTEIIALEVTDSIQELSLKFIETGLSKILIYKDSIDNIIGYTRSYELFKMPSNITSILLPISIVPEAMPANEILELFIKQRKSLAVVVDEYGGTSGMLTIEDVVEQIIGDIEDEHDVDTEIEEVVNNQTFRFSARIEIDYLNEEYKLNLPESDEYTTLAGYIISIHESIPQKNDIIEDPNYRFEIEEVTENRIEKVLIHKKPMD